MIEVVETFTATVKFLCFCLTYENYSCVYQAFVILKTFAMLINHTGQNSSIL